MIEHHANMWNLQETDRPTVQLKDKGVYLRITTKQQPVVRAANHFSESRLR